MKFLLTGRNGQIGCELERCLAPLGEIIALSRKDLDLAEPEQIVARVREIRPDVIVNAAAYTAVDAAENDVASAMAINGAAAGIFAGEAKRIGALLVHYSTDYVFDGTKQQPYSEDDAPNPVNVYGASKLAGEKAIEASGCKFIILRTSWVYSLRGKNFLLTILRLAANRSELRVVDDQFGAPTLAFDIASITSRILKRQAPLQGIYHLTAAGCTSWHGFAQEIIDVEGLDVRVVPIKTTEYSPPAKRPANSIISNDKLRRVCGLSMPPWKDGLLRCLATMNEMSLAGDSERNRGRS